MSETTPDASVAETLISARLLMLQSKRLILATLERRLRQRPIDELPGRVEHMRVETDNAQDVYCTSMLRWGSPATPDYWPVAYRRLVEIADRLSSKLRRSATDLPPAERYQLAAEVEMLEVLVDRWRESIRASMASVA
ncbi:MAG: hypothetical protein E6J06_01565 [Chloroflexi bacterium]|nr:MAG: hypothetical protein E6J06_01565 [Chloroflexota bacterium]